MLSNPSKVRNKVKRKTKKESEKEDDKGNYNHVNYLGV